MTAADITRHPVYAWVTLLADGSPSIVGAYMPALAAHAALVGFNPVTVRQMRPLAEHHARVTGQAVYLVRLGGMEILDDLTRAGRH